jgi:hypothetical protein
MRPVWPGLLTPGPRHRHRHRHRHCTAMDTDMEMEMDRMPGRTGQGTKKCARRPSKEATPHLPSGLRGTSSSVAVQDGHRCCILLAHLVASCAAGSLPTLPSLPSLLPRATGCVARRDMLPSRGLSHCRAVQEHATTRARICPNLGHIVFDLRA